jgi:ribonuclease BN (tRNA processing enzyme)
LQAGRQAEPANVKRLLLTHLWPGIDPAAARAEAAAEFGGETDVALSGMVVDLER